MIRQFAVALVFGGLLVLACRARASARGGADADEPATDVAGQAEPTDAGVGSPLARGGEVAPASEPAESAPPPARAPSRSPDAPVVRSPAPLPNDPLPSQAVPTCERLEAAACRELGLKLELEGAPTSAAAVFLQACELGLAAACHDAEAMAVKAGDLQLAGRLGAYAEQLQQNRGALPIPVPPWRARKSGDAGHPASVPVGGCPPDAQPRWSKASETVKAQMIRDCRARAGAAAVPVRPGPGPRLDEDANSLHPLQTIGAGVFLLSWIPPAVAGIAIDFGLFLWGVLAVLLGGTPPSAIEFGMPALLVLPVVGPLVDGCLAVSNRQRVFLFNTPDDAARLYFTVAAIQVGGLLTALLGRALQQAPPRVGRSGVSLHVLPGAGGTPAGLTFALDFGP